MRSTSEPSISSDHRKENDVPVSEGPSTCSTSVSSAAAKVSNESSNEDSPSKRKGLIGSLRKQKLRSIGSLRSLRSPTRTKQADVIANYPVDVVVVNTESEPPSTHYNPHTPKHPTKSSLALDFEESPPGQPIFDLSRKEYTNSGLDIHRSSPMPVPSSDKQSLRSPIQLSVIPDGTVPSSPAPIRKILDLDPTEDSPSGIFSSCRVPDQIITKATAPVEKPLSDILRAAADYYQIPAIDGQEKPMSLGSITQTVEIRQADSYTESWSAWSEYRRGLLDEFGEKSPPEDEVFTKAGEETKDDAPSEARGEQEDGADTRPNMTALDLLRQKQRANIYRRADGKRQMQVRLAGSDAENADDPEWWDKTEAVSGGRNEDFTAAEKMVSNLGVFVRNDEILVKAEGKELTPDEAHAVGKITAYVDIELEPASTEETESRMLQPANMEKRGSSWGAHAGLYDGTGYGSGPGSTSSPTTVINGTEVDHESLVLVRSRINNLSTGTASFDTREYKDYADFESLLATRHVS